MKTDMQNTTAEPPASLPASEPNAWERIVENLNPWRESARLTGDGKVREMENLLAAVGYRYADCRLNNFEVYEPALQGPVLERLRNVALCLPGHLGTGAGLIFSGKPGTGKDHLLTAMLKVAIAKHGLSVEWFDGMALYRNARHAISVDGEQAFFNRLKRPHILAISDPQPPQGALTDGQLRLIRDAVDARYRETKGTWMTTNINTAKAAEEMFTGPLLSRLKHGALQFACDWAGYRERPKT